MANVEFVLDTAIPAADGLPAAVDFSGRSILAGNLRRTLRVLGADQARAAVPAR